jgi:hypothetical protein
LLLKHKRRIGLKLFCIVDDERKLRGTAIAIKAAADARDIPIVFISASTFDTTNTPDIPAGYGLYRDGTSRMAKLAEKLLYRCDLKTYYANEYTIFMRDPMNGAIRLLGSGVSIPREVLAPSQDLDMLLRQVEVVGGFPVVLKSSGLSHGEGVSLHKSLDSLAEMIALDSPDNLVLKEFIDYESHARMIVLDGKVIDSVEYQKVEGDFRTNAHEDITVIPKKYSTQIESEAVNVVSSLGYTFGGVDVLVKDGKGYVAELNTPCNFTRASDVTGVDIAGMIVESFTSNN